MSITQNTVGTSATTLYTSSGTSATSVVYFMNDHSADATIQLHIVKNAGTASTSNKIVKNLIITAADTYVMDLEKLLLDNGDMIQASSDVDAVVHATVVHIEI